MAEGARTNAEAREAALSAKLAELQSEIRAVDDELTAIRSFLATLEHFERSAAPAPAMAGHSQRAGSKRLDQNPPRTEVVRAVIEIIEASGAPMQRQPLFDALAARGIVIRGKDPTLVLATMLWRSQDEVVKLPRRGYWIAGRSYPPASYAPAGASTGD